MRVELLVNLKISNGNIIRKGTVFDDTYSPFPGTIKRKIGTKLVRILPDKSNKKWGDSNVVRTEDFHFEELPPKESEVMVEKEKVEVVEEETLEEDSVEEEPEEKKKPVRRTYARKKKDADSDKKPKRTRRSNKKVDTEDVSD